MTLLSVRAKDAIKTALAMVFAYGGALSMDWDRPYWAGLTVAMCCLSTFGESINKGLLRLFGNFLAIIVTLTLLALFPQDRWLFVLVTSLYVAFCTYMMLGTTRWYFWFVGGFAVPLLAIAGGPIALNAFELVMLRAQETMLGIAAYSLVWIFLWPTSTRATFEAAVRRLADIQRQLFARYLALATGGSDDDSAKGLMLQATQTQAGLKGLLDGAELDSFDVWETRHAWHRCVRELSQLTDTLESWRQGFEETKGLELERLIPDFPAFGAEFDRRLAEIGRMLAGHPPERKPWPLELRLDEQKLLALPHFQRAALVLCRNHMRQLDRLTSQLFETVGDIRGFIRADPRALDEPAPALPALLDVERLASVARQFTALWLAFLAWIYVPDLPNPAVLIVVANALSMYLALTPQVPVTALFLPAAFGVTLAGAVHILVLPHLSSFTGLGIVIFGSVFLICYMFSRPSQMAAKFIGLALLVAVVHVTNEQQYSFLMVANWGMVWPLIFTVLAVTTHVPVSFRPEKVFLRTLRRFFRGCAYLASTLRWDPGHSPTHLDLLRKAVHARNVATGPGQLAVWGRALPKGALGDATPEQVQALVTSLQALAYRMQNLLEARDYPQAEALVRELLTDVRAWRLGVQGIFGNLAAKPDAAERAAFRSRLDAVLDRLEVRIEQALDKADAISVSAEEGENMYRLLGAYRGASEALVDFAAQAGQIDWARLREARF